MGRMKFYCDTGRCIDCNGCVVACKEAHEIPVGINRRRVVTINEGIIGEEMSMSVACMHCADAPCQQICPTDCFYIREDGVVLHDKKKCIGCGYCLFACPFGAPQFPKTSIFGTKGKMDKCTFCAGGPDETHSKEEFHNYGQNRMAEGKPPMCASMCSTKALLAGDSDEISRVFLSRVVSKGKGAEREPPIWKQAYGGQ